MAIPKDSYSELNKFPICPGWSGSDVSGYVYVYIYMYVYVPPMYHPPTTHPPVCTTATHRGHTGTGWTARHGTARHGGGVYVCVCICVCVGSSCMSEDSPVHQHWLSINVVYV